MNVEVLPDAESVARRAAEFIAAEARAAVSARGRFALAVSGGHTPWQMLRVLATLDVPWNGVHLFQVDERVAPTGDPDRNWTHIGESLLGSVSLPRQQLHPMPVEDLDLAAAAGRYATELASVADTPPVLDLVQLPILRAPTMSEAEVAPVTPKEIP